MILVWVFLYFGACVRSLHSGLSEFPHQIVVHRRDESLRSWRNWILVDPLVHPYRWLQPDLVPPSPFLSCDRVIMSGGSGVSCTLRLLMSTSEMLGFPSSVGQAQGLLIPLFSMQKLGAGCQLLRRLSSLLWLDRITKMLFSGKSPLLVGGSSRVLLLPGLTALLSSWLGLSWMALGPRDVCFLTVLGYLRVMETLLL